MELNWSELVMTVAGEVGHLCRQGHPPVWCEHLRPDFTGNLDRDEKEDGSSVNIKYGGRQCSVYWMKTRNCSL